MAEINETTIINMVTTKTTKTKITVKMRMRMLEPIKMVRVIKAE